MCWLYHTVFCGEVGFAESALFLPRVVTVFMALEIILCGESVFFINVT